MDDIDRRILRCLQDDCRMGLTEIGARAGLSPSACHRRIRQLEQAGVIAAYGARLDPRELGYAMEMFIEVTLTSQSVEALGKFEQAVTAVPEIIECHLMAGGTDYLIRVLARSVADFERIHRERLAKLPFISRMESRLALRSVRQWTGYPIP